MESVQRFCGFQNNQSFTIWDEHNQIFNQCFLWTVTTSFTHSLFLVVSAFLFGISRRSFTKQCSCLLLLVSILTLLLALTSILELILSYSLKLKHPPAYVLSKTLSFSAWLSYLTVHQRTYVISRKKKLEITYIMVVTFFIFISATMQLYNVVRHLEKHNADMNVNDYGTIVYAGLIFLLLLVFIRSYFVSIEKTLFNHNIPSLSQNVTSIQSDDSESTSLLFSSHSCDNYKRYQKPNADIYLGKAEITKNIFSKVSFWWANKLILKGYYGQLDSPNDLYILPNNLDTRKIKDVVSTMLRIQRHESIMEALSTNTIEAYESTKIKRKKYKVSLIKCLHNAFGRFYYSLAILKFVWDGCGFTGPILLNYLVKFMESKNEPAVNGYYYAFGLFLSSFLSVFLNLTYQYQIRKVGLQIRAGLISTIYEKTLSVSTSALSKFTTGQIVNFMSTDTDRVANFAISFHEFWSLPFQIGVCLYLLYKQVGLAFLAGLGFIILLIPINKYLSFKICEINKALMQHKDARVKMLSEILNGIRIIKLYAWEDHFLEKVRDARSKEVKQLKTGKYLDALCVVFWATTPVIISLLTFSVYVALGNELTAAKVFTSIALFNLLVTPLNSFPWVINGLIESWVSLKRIEDYLSLVEVNLGEYYVQATLDEAEKIFEMENASFCWGSHERPEDQKDKSTTNSSPVEREKKDTSHSVNSFQLTNIHLNVQKGQLLGVMGKVGSGKSSLFAAITAEMEKIAGDVYLEDEFKGFAFVTQEPWIQHMTLRDNVLFGKPYDHDRYESILVACALNEDINLLPAGDLTEVGENGVTLSGGQKARLSLARAIYQDKEVYLLDDPIAAVDAHVGAHIFNHCIMGLLKHKTRILCTHHTNYLWRADSVILMEDGKVALQGPPEDLLKIDSSVKHPGNSSKQKCSHVDSTEDVKSDSSKEKDQGKLVEDEKKVKGSVSLKVYKSYWNSVGNVLAPLIFVFLALMQASRNISDWWLAYWISNSKANDTLTVYYDMHMTYGRARVSATTQFYLKIYGYLAAGNIVFTLFRAFLFAYGGIRATQRLHELLLVTIINAPIPFFDANPIGRIINRFSSDIFTTDDSLPFILNVFLACAFGVLGTIVMTCYGIPWFAAVLVPLAAIYYFTQHYYRKASRELKRLSSVTLSPIYEHFSETLAGLMTIRSFRETHRFVAENERKLDFNQRANYSGLVATVWLRLRLEIMSVFMVTSVAVLAVVEHHFNSINPGLVGLAISYALAVTPRLGSLVSSFTESEKNMISVERIMQYVVDTKPEDQGSFHVDHYWPQQGIICFRNVSLQYREGLPNALNGVSFYVKPAEKIGICGRTGSGKSSLFRLLFKTILLTEGEIIIDGVNIENVHLRQLRSQMSIIPQDPFLFDDTIAVNLDPKQQHTTFEMLDVLEKCKLLKFVEDLGGLGSSAGAKGQNFSAGQKQLLCLARALLKKSKIICIDEATASVDFETDHLIQQTIREEFVTSTVLTIAHRIDTIMDSDRVLVLNDGQVIEFAPPSDLLSDHETVFYSLVREHASSRKQ